MISDQLRQLLTAYVDGELTNRQRKAALRLVRRSPEARGLLAKLEADAERLRRLPRLRLPDDFSARVVEALRGRPLPMRRARRAAAPVPFWGAVAAAAALLLTVGLTSYAFFARQLTPTGPGTVAVPRVPVPDNRGAADAAALPENDQVAVAPRKPDVPPAVPAGPEALAVMPAAVVEDASAPPKPSVPAGAGKVITVPVIDMEMFKPSVAPVTVFPLFNVRALEATKLAKELEKVPAFRIELPCRDTSRAFRRLETALKEVGVTLAIDQTARGRLDRPRLKGNYVFFLEDVTPDELARALARLGSDDRKAAEAKPKHDGQFSKLILDRMSDADRKELLDLFHNDTRPVTAARAEAPKALGRGSERLALAATYNPERPRPGSPEVKRYFDSRKPLRPGALQVLLVLREAPG